MTLHVDNPGNLPDAEIVEYVRRAEDMIAAGTLPEDTCRMEIVPVGDEVDIRYYRPCDRGIDRIRRLTGYLVGSLDRWNSAKRAEERDRVKHLSIHQPNL